MNIESPYRGLEPYDETSARYFFGRERDTSLIAANMFGAPLTLLYGPSGVGKTSVLQAGVLPALKHREHCVTTSLREWQDEPTLRLKSLLGESPTSTDTSRPLADIVVERAVDGKRVMIVLDQFEEYFIYWPEGSEFERELATLLTVRNLPLGVLVSIREDALARLDRFEGRVPYLFDNIFRVGHLDRAAATDAIEKPLERFNEDYPAERVGRDPKLADAVLARMQVLRPTVVAAGGVGSDSVSSVEWFETPYLQLMMLELWRDLGSGSDKQLSLEMLERLGSARHVVERHVDRALGELTDQEQDVAARIFDFLVTPSGSKIAHTTGDLAAYTELPQAQLVGVLTRLAGEVRILRSVPPPLDQPRESAYEIYHDVLARAILVWRANHVRLREQPTPRGEEPRRPDWVSEADGVFAAGGVKLLALAGGLEAFSDHPTRPVLKWVNIAGSGGGAVVAALLATGHEASEIVEILQRTSLGRFTDPGLGGKWRGMVNLLRGRGFATGEGFSRWLDDILGGATFSAVRQPDDRGWRLNLIAADVSGGHMLVLPGDLQNYRDPATGRPIDPDEFSIARAVRMSMSIPYFFEPVQLTSQTGQSATILDGGLFSDLPIWLFDLADRAALRPTFGVRVVGRVRGGDLPRASTFWPRSVQLGLDIFRMTSDAVDMRFTAHSTRLRTCVVDAGDVATTDFNLSADRQGMLVQNGRHAATAFLDAVSLDHYVNSFGRSLAGEEPVPLVSA